jgi:transposase
MSDDVMIDVMIAVDPHKASNTAAVMDPVTRTLIETARFSNSDEGYTRLAGFARRWEHRRWAVEGCHGAGRSLAQRLVAGGETVLDVPAKLARGSAFTPRGTAARPTSTTRYRSAWLLSRARAWPPWPAMT